MKQLEACAKLFHSQTQCNVVFYLFDRTMKCSYVRSNHVFKFLGGGISPKGILKFKDENGKSPDKGTIKPSFPSNLLFKSLGRLLEIFPNLLHREECLHKNVIAYFRPLVKVIQNVLVTQGQVIRDSRCSMFSVLFF